MGRRGGDGIQSVHLSAALCAKIQSHCETPTPGSVWEVLPGWLLVPCQVYISLSGHVSVCVSLYFVCGWHGAEGHFLALLGRGHSHTTSVLAAASSPGLLLHSAKLINAGWIGRVKTCLFLTGENRYSKRVAADVYNPLMLLFGRIISFRNKWSRLGPSSLFVQHCYLGNTLVDDSEPHNILCVAQDWQQDDVWLCLS